MAVLGDFLDDLIGGSPSGRLQLLVQQMTILAKSYMRDFLHVSPEPSFWASCAQPHLTQLTDGSKGYAVFRVGA